jgi:hypothetical protein
MREIDVLARLLQNQLSSALSRLFTRMAGNK